MNAQRQDQVVLHAKVGVAGRYRLRVGKRGQEPRIDTGWFDNIITDAGLNFMGDNDNFLNACQVGSGTGTPAAGDTSLGSFVAGTDTQQDFSKTAEATSPFFSKITKTYRFAEGAAAGNLSEVGIGDSTTAGTLFSRALITDSGGTATTITVLSDEFLDVTYQLQLVPPTADATFNVTDAGPDGTVHAVTLRAADADSAAQRWDFGGDDGNKVQASTNNFVGYDGAISTVDAKPSGNSSVASSLTTAAYSNNSLERLATASFGLNNGNFASDLKSIWFVFTSAGTWQAEFDPVIPKDNTKTLSITVKVSWTRTTAL